MRFTVKNSKTFSTLLTATFLSLNFSACTPSTQHQINSSDAELNPSKIIAGLEIDNNSILSKNVVLLVNALTSEVCTASLLGGQFALTAAHCLGQQENTDNLYLFFAAKPDGTTERRRVIAKKESPYWDLRQFEDFNSSDIAVIKFEGTTLPKGYKAVQFLTDEKKIRKGARVIVLGYGIKDATTQAGAGILRYTTLTISDPEYSPTEILLDQSKGSAVCHGDSGGPAYLSLKDSRGNASYYLWGIANKASLDDKKIACDKSVIYTNAVLYFAWIQNVMQTLK